VATDQAAGAGPRSPGAPRVVVDLLAAGFADGIIAGSRKVHQAHQRKHPEHLVTVTFGGWTCVGSMTEDCEIGGEIQT
jgi:hypothetical protein